MTRVLACTVLLCLASGAFVWSRPQSANCLGDPRAAASPDGTLTACLGPGPELVVSHSNTQQTSRFLVSDCPAPVTVEWIDAIRIGLICQMADLSLRNYLVLDAITGQLQGRYAGLWFMWSPDRKTLAHIGVVQRYGTPEGDNYCLLMNERTAYPDGCTFEGNLAASTSPKRRSRFAYSGVHTFYPDLAWSPDSSRLAFVEKTFDFEYNDPFNRYWDGTVTSLRAYLVIVPLNGAAQGYRLREVPSETNIHWNSDTEVQLEGEAFSLTTNPPRPLH
ncbi:MAG: hypothetical protein JO270_21050 [Acidobacteriaceae bacterium]|nr:hypothetical protein [Acidobacteriaceae bacterium]